MAPELCMVKTAAARKFGLSAKKVKEPFLWFQLVDFAVLYDIHNQGYCHLIISTITALFLDQCIVIVLLFALMRKNVLFWTLTILKLYAFFERRKNSQFRHDNKVTVAILNSSLVCPLKL
jgi:hypothetical protein